MSRAVPPADPLCPANLEEWRNHLMEAYFECFHLECRRRVKSGEMTEDDFRVMREWLEEEWPKHEERAHEVLKEAAVNVLDKMIFDYEAL